MPKIIIALSAFLLLVGGGCISQSNSNQQNQPTEPVYCTMEAKECPDGSYVGRTGPNCEFTPCPLAIVPPKNSGSKTVTVGGVVTFQIPSTCNASPAAGSIYITCPTPDNETPIPEFVFSSDGTQINMKRWEGLNSPYWDDVVASLRILTPLNRAIQINIDK